MKRIIAAALLSIMPMIVTAQDFDKGLAAAQADDFLTAIQEWKPIAESGDANVQYNLGIIYEAMQAHTEAAAWYRLAADQGMSVAQSALAYKYLEGQGVVKSFVESLKWYRLAADQGSAEGQRRLGEAYALGIGVTQDFGEAFKWLLKSAKQGNAAAQTGVGMAYAGGHGVKQNEVLGYMWLTLSVDTFGTETEYANTATAWLTALSNTMTTAEVSLGQEMARSCLERSYNQCDEVLEVSQERINRLASPTIETNRDVSVPEWVQPVQVQEAPSDIPEWAQPVQVQEAPSDIPEWAQPVQVQEAPSDIPEWATSIESEDAFLDQDFVQIAANTSGEEADYVQSQRCSGALSIMTALGLEDETLPIYKYFSDLLDFQSFILEYYVSERIDDSVMGDVSRSVSQGVILVDDEMIKDTNSLQLTVKHCLSWLSEVKIHFAAQVSSTPTSIVMGTMPSPSDIYEYPFSDWTPMIPIIEAAYDLWRKSGLRGFHRCKSTGLKQTIHCFSLEKE